MRPHATLDLETDPFKKNRDPKAFCGAFYDGKRTAYAETVGDGLSCCVALIRGICVPSYKDFLVYAHNGGKFDFHFIIEALLDIYPYDKIETLCIGSRIVQIKTPTVTFRDSFSIIPRRLKDIASAEKKEIEIWKLEENACDLSYHDLPTEKGRTLSAYKAHLRSMGIDTEQGDLPSPREIFREEIKAYLYQDVKGLYHALEEFFTDYGQEITLASTCFKVLKKQFEMPAVRTNLQFDNEFRNFYYAGRVQFFSLGKMGNIDEKIRYSCVDINSAFPWAMTQNHWFSPDRIRLDRPPKQNPENCFYEITCNSNGALPMRTPHGIDFPMANNQKFFASGWELFAALELGLVSDVRYHACYLPTAVRDFTNYVEHFYEMKKNAEGSARDFAKLFLNSAYGKFALNPREFRDVKTTDINERPEPYVLELRKKDANGNTQYREIEWELSYEDKKRGIRFWQIESYHEDGRKPLSFNNVATAASITACVRAYLMRSMALCSGVLYCDTDSIIASDVSSLPLGEELGKWKLEKEMDAVFVGGKKLYAGHDYRGATTPKKDKEWKIASKGVRLSPEQICNVALGNEESYTFDAPNYSAFSAPHYTTRRVNRDDKRKRR